MRRPAYEAVDTTPHPLPVRPRPAIEIRSGAERPISGHCDEDALTLPLVAIARIGQRVNVIVSFYRPSNGGRSWPRSPSRYTYSVRSSGSVAWPCRGL